MNNGEYIHSAERGNFTKALRRKVPSGFDSVSSNDVKELENTLYNYYYSQLILQTVNLIAPFGDFPPNWRISNWSLVESFIRNNNILLPIGRDGLGNIRVLRTDMSSGMGLNLFLGLGFSSDDGVITDEVTGDKLYPITDDKPDEGDYVIFSNKNIASFITLNITDYASSTLNLSGMSDIDLIESTAMRLAVNKATAYQNMKQMRSSKIFASRNKSISGAQMTQSWLDGYTIIGMDPSHSLGEQLTDFDGSDQLAPYLAALRAERDDLMGEYDMWLGVNNVGVFKESGVSDIEASAKMQTSQTMAAIYLSARQNPMDKLCRRFGGDVKFMYNQPAASQIEMQLKTTEAEMIQQQKAAQDATTEAALDPQ